jgi:hypothetical protein
MHIQIVNFNLQDMSHADFARACDEQFAPAFSNIPGLISKMWLRDPASNAYCGVYAWEDRDEMLRFQQTELFQGIISNPHFANLTAHDYALMEGPSRVTNGIPAVPARR